MKWIYGTRKTPQPREQSAWLGMTLNQLRSFAEYIDGGQDYDK
jgi:hypothetical protein